MRRHVLPTIGNVPLGRLTSDHVRAVLAKLAGSGLSPTTVAMVRDTLATILERATKDRIIAFNPLDAVDSVTRATPRNYVLTPDKARALLRAAEGDEYEASSSSPSTPGSASRSCSGSSGAT